MNNGQALMKTKKISHRFPTLLVLPMLLLSALIIPISTTQAGLPVGQLNPVARKDNLSALRVIQTTADMVVLELIPPAPQFEATLLKELSCQNVSIPGLAQIDTPGLPALPAQGAMLGIPQNAQLTIGILDVESTILPGKHTLCPLPQSDLKGSLVSPWQLIGNTYRSAATVQVDAFMPSEPAQLISTGNLRDQRYAEVRFSPLQYNPVTHVLRYYQRIRLAVYFNAPWSHATASPQAVSTDRFFEDNYRSLLVNYDQARLWRNQPHPAIQPEMNFLLSQPAYKISVNQDGLYQVSYTDLQSAEVPVGSLDPRTIRLFNQSDEVAIFVQGEADGVFNSDDYLLFYGQKVESKYTDTNVYWLTWGGSNGLRMSSLDGTPAGSASVPTDFLTTKHAEINAMYRAPERSGPDGDHWYWDEIIAFSGPSSKNFTTTLQHLSPGSQPISIRGLLKGYSGIPNHHTRIYLNDQLIDDHTFPSGTEYAYNLSVLQSDLIEGVNTLKVECPRDDGITLDVVGFNWFEIDYFHTFFADNDRLYFDSDQPGTQEFHVDGFSSASLEAYDVTNPLSPLRITGGVVQPTANGQQLAFQSTITDEHRYLTQTTDQRLTPLSIIEDIPSNWKSTSNAADYIIITHAAFLSQVQPLADFRSSQGLRVQVVDVQDLYDEFNGGVFSPEAIRSSLAYAYVNWIPPAPSFVLLVGDGNFDYRNFYGLNTTNYIPPYLDEVDPWVGENATDNRFVSVNGGDILPDMYIGRFPVRNATEAQTMVEKTINYELSPVSGDWNTKQTFVADNADASGDYPFLSDQIVNTYVPSAYTVDKIYYGVNYTNSNDAKAALLASINQGRQIVHFSGHGSTQYWGSENLLSTNDLASLTNGSRLPFIIPMTCADGYFIWPQSNYSSLGESIVRMSGGGAIASWSPAGYGLSSGHALLDESLFSDLFIWNNNQLGFLTTHAKYQLYANSSGHNDLIETYILFGDPALRLQIIPGTRQLIYLPLVSR